jgi:hypothetical protein
MLRAGFEPAITATERAQTYGSERAATGIGAYRSTLMENSREMSAIYITKLAITQVS